MLDLANNCWKRTSFFAKTSSINFSQLLPLSHIDIGVVYCSAMDQRALKNINNCLNTNIYSYLETSGGQSSNLYLNVVHFSTPVLIRHLWQL